jgi:hypothetical protein
MQFPTTFFFIFFLQKLELLGGPQIWGRGCSNWRELLVQVRILFADRGLGTPTLSSIHSPSIF